MAVKRIGVTQAAAELGVSDRRVRVLCEEGRIVGAEKIGPTWIIPTPIKITEGGSGPSASFETVPAKRRRKKAA